MDTHQHCKGGVISNEMRTHEQCSRACLDAPDCVGYSIALRDPYQCYLKSKECEMVGQHSTWTFIKKSKKFKLLNLFPLLPVPFPKLRPLNG